MRILDFIRSGGLGSGCRGDNCGRAFKEGMASHYKVSPGGMTAYGFQQTFYNDPNKDTDYIHVLHDTNNGSVTVQDNVAGSRFVRMFPSEKKAHDYLKFRGVAHNFEKAKLKPEAGAAKKYGLYTYSMLLGGRKIRELLNIEAKIEKRKKE